MNTQTQKLKCLVSVAFVSSLLSACSVEQKPTMDTGDIVADENIVIEDDPSRFIEPENTMLPSDDYVQQAERILIMPKAKPRLSKKQLFAGALDAHNRVRAKHGIKPLKWSDKLAAYSQQWADHLGKGNSCQMYHRSGSPAHGENLYISSAVVWSDRGKEVMRERNRVTIRNVVKTWADEERWYNYNTNSCQPGQQCGHYTQIVWRDTTEVGCAVKFCGDQSQNWVCSYNPPGNYVGKQPY